MSEKIESYKEKKVEDDALETALGMMTPRQRRAYEEKMNPTGKADVAPNWPWLLLGGILGAVVAGVICFVFCWFILGRAYVY